MIKTDAAALSLATFARGCISGEDISTAASNAVFISSNENTKAERIVQTTYSHVSKSIYQAERFIKIYPRI